ncbi:MAG: DegT/DnrJ/EryC1/StrS family aminotransferase [Patescibacteria group bacterium]
MKNIKAFKNPINVVKPILPDLTLVTKKLEEIWASGWLTNKGKQHEELEKRVTEYLKVVNTSLFCNGTLALQIACQALDLKGEVITTPFTFPATTHVLHWNNLTPVFCDIEENTYNIDPNKIETLITSKTTAIMPVHVFGNPCDVEKIQKIADKYNLKIIYDAAHAFGVEINGKPIGNFGDISMFSFHATKIFHTIEGGALTFGNNKLKNKIEQLKNFGLIDDVHVEGPGTNAKLNEVSAAVGILMFDSLEEEKKRRKALTNLYRKNLKNIPGIKVIPDLEKVKHNYYAMPILINKSKYGLNRNVLFEKLKKYNIFARRYFYPLCSQYPCYAKLPSAKNLFIAEQITEEILCLPLYGSLKKDEVEKICYIVKNITK